MRAAGAADGVAPGVLIGVCVVGIGVCVVGAAEAELGSASVAALA